MPFGQEIAFLSIIEEAVAGNLWRSAAAESCFLPVRKCSIVSLWVIFRRLRPEYVARVGSAPYDSRIRTTSRWSFSTAS